MPGFAEVPRRQRCGCPASVSGFTRQRVMLALDQVWDHRLGLVLAPPGAGNLESLVAGLETWSRTAALLIVDDLADR